MFRSAFSVLLLLPALLPAADAVQPRWQLKKGQKLSYLFKHHEDRNVKVGTESFDTKTEMDLTWQWTVADVDDKSALLEAKVTALRVTIAAKNFDFAYDSTGPNASDDGYKKDLIAWLDAVRGGAYKLRLTPDGQVSDVDGLDKAYSDTKTENAAGDVTGYNLRDASFGWYLQQAVGVLPGAAVAEGARWKRPAKVKLAGQGEIDGTTEYHLKKVTKEECVIAFEGNHSYDVDTKLGTLAIRGPMKIANVKGSVLFGTATGRAERGEYVAEMTGDFKLGDNADAPTLKVVLKHTVTLEARK